MDIINIQTRAKLRLSNIEVFGDLENEMEELFAFEEPLLLIENKITEARRKADEYLNEVRTKYPNRYFILKRITQNPEFWEICIQKKMYITNDDNFIKKLQNCYEVYFIIYLIKRFQKMFF